MGASDPGLARPPAEWEVVTRDLFKDHGEFTITGVAFSPLDGEYALFDHVLLGRTVGDLDRATDAALGRVKPGKAMERQEREAAWEHLMGGDRVKAAAAPRLAGVGARPRRVHRRRLGREARQGPAPRVQKLLKALDADEFNAPTAPPTSWSGSARRRPRALRTMAAAPPSEEAGYRARLILRKLGDTGTSSTADRHARVVRIFERARQQGGPRPARAIGRGRVRLRSRARREGGPGADGEEAVTPLPLRAWAAAIAVTAAGESLRRGTEDARQAEVEHASRTLTGPASLPPPRGPVSR